MDSRIAYIVYFGAPKDGFEIYPRVASAESIVSGYYTSAGSDWLLTASKIGNITAHTYVRYGLLTAAEQGREGSCLGISIGLIGSYFADLDLLRKEVYEKMFGVFESEGVLLELQKGSGKLAFKAYSLKQVAPYLDDKTEAILRKVLGPNYSQHIVSFATIPDSINQPVYAVHPESSSLAINELFETYGVVRLSPNATIETKSASQKAAEQIKGLQQRNVLLAEELKQRESHVDTLRKQLGPTDGGSRSQYYKQALTDAANYIERLETETGQLRENISREHVESLKSQIAEVRAKLSREVDRNHQLESQARGRGVSQAQNAAPSYDTFAEFLSKQRRKIAWGVGIILVLVVVLTWRWSSDTPRIDDGFGKNSSPTPLSSPTPKPNESSFGVSYDYDGRDPDIKTINGLVATILNHCGNSDVTKARVLDSIPSLNQSLLLDHTDLSKTNIQGVPVRFETPKDCRLTTQHFISAK